MGQIDFKKQAKNWLKKYDLENSSFNMEESHADFAKYMVEKIYSTELKESKLIREQLNAQSVSDGETMNELIKDLQKSKELLKLVMDDYKSIGVISLRTKQKVQKFLTNYGK